MSLAPVGYEPFKGARRKGITLLCLLMGSAIFSGMFIYIDSYSIYRWDDYVNSSNVAMIIRGDDSSYFESTIANMDGVTKVSVLKNSWLNYHLIGTSNTWDSSCRTIEYNKETFDLFPNVVKLVSGRFPGAITEVTVSSERAAYEQLKLNDFLNVSIYRMNQDYIHLKVRVVGIFSSSLIPSQYGYYSYLGDMIVDKALMDLTGTSEVSVFIDIDRSGLSPYDRGAAYAKVKAKELEIMRAIDPNYDPSAPWTSNYDLSPILSTSITMYSMWITLTRFGELMRNMGFILLFTLTIMLAVRYNINDRRFESEMLIARGATLSSTQSMAYKEIMALSIIGSIGGIGIGILLSRIGMASQDFLTYDFSKLVTAPLLVGLDSLIMAVILTILLTFLGITGYLIVLAPKPHKEKQQGKLAKIGRILTLIRWDMLTIILTSLFLYALYQSGSTSMSYGFLSVFINLGLTVSPLILFLAITNLYGKGIKRNAVRLSSVLRKVFGTVPSQVGVRRIGRRSSSAALVTMVIVLAISLAWASAVVESSLPATKIAQAHYAFGSDVAFHLDSISQDNWTNFIGNLSSYDGVEVFTQVSTFEVSLDSTGRYTAHVVGLKPEEFIPVGYGPDGVSVANSPMQTMLEKLEQSSTGALITESLATTLSLTAGDIIRGFTSVSGNTTIASWNVVDIAKALSPLSLTETGTIATNYRWVYSVVGANTIWANWDYIQTLTNNSWSIMNNVLVRVSPGTNSTELAEQVLGDWNSVLQIGSPYSCDQNELKQYKEQSTYLFDGAINNINIFGSVIVILAVFVLYATEDIHSRKREIALLRAMGAGQGSVRRIQIAEMATLLLGSSLLLLLFGSLFISSTMFTTSVSLYRWPFLAITVLPIETLLAILLFYVISTLLFIVAVARKSVMINLAEALNASWTAATPLGGEL